MTAETFAYEVAPRGCTCGNNGGGDCEWCLAFDSVVTTEEFEAARLAGILSDEYEIPPLHQHGKEKR